MTLHVSNLTSDVQASATAARLAQSGTVTPSISSGLYRNFFKRVIDVTLVVLSAPVVVVVVSVLALIVTVLTGGKPFYSQLRVGRHGKSFRMWKLRTMVPNADAYLKNYLQQNPDAQLEWDKTQKLKQDPRITAIGRLLRKTSFDELPQLFNVLNGTMSLVGPRPMMLEQKTSYQGRAYYDLRPGITGLWQVCDRNDCYFEDRASFDDTYNDELSLKTDTRILFKTVGVVLRATGH